MLPYSIEQLHSGQRAFHTLSNRYQFIVDGNSKTREEFTRNLLSEPTPDGAAEKWSSLDQAQNAPRKACLP